MFTPWLKKIATYRSSNIPQDAPLPLLWACVCVCDRTGQGNLCFEGPLSAWKLGSKHYPEEAVQGLLSVILIVTSAAPLATKPVLLPGFLAKACQFS